MHYISVKDDGARQATVLKPMVRGELEGWLRKASNRHQDWVKANGFKAGPGQVCTLPAEGGSIEAVLFGMQPEGWLTQLAAIVKKLPRANYRLESEWSRDQRLRASLGWGLACYRFDRYKDAADSLPSLVLDEDIEADVRSQSTAQALVRDLINTPASDMGPEELAAAAASLAARHGARCSVIVGDDLLAQNYPAIHAVGRASDREPRLIDLAWGEPGHPKVTLVGKGVCFDTGGLNLKPSAGMKLMKKDMGGAANVLGLAHMVMSAGLPVRLRVLIPAVENSVSGNAMRPLDVVPTREGLTVEIGNTDAEGRVILADALSEAASEAPDLLLDFATLTGAARVALGVELPALFSNDDALADDLVAAGQSVVDRAWRLPLWEEYQSQLDSPFADMKNVGGMPAGVLTAACFLSRFAEDQRWAHLDVAGSAWKWGTDEGASGRPVGLLAQYLLNRSG